MWSASGEQLALGGRNGYNQRRPRGRARQRRVKDKRNLIRHPWSRQAAVEADGKLKLMLLSPAGGTGEQSSILGRSNDARAQQQPPSAGA